MPYQTPPTFTDGEILSASQLNTLASNQNELNDLASSANLGFAQFGLSTNTSRYFRVIHSYDNLFLIFGEHSSSSSLRVYYGATLVYTSPGNGQDHTVNVNLASFGLVKGQPYTVRLRASSDDATEIYYLSKTGAPV